VNRTAIEVCVDSVASAVAAQEGGADRIELCDNLAADGTTPSAGMIAEVRRRVSIGLIVMIRPRGGDFTYAPEELAVMEADIATAKGLGADGIALGILTPQGFADVARLRRLIEAARPMSVTFHRAFDISADPLQTTEDLCALGVDRLLTSGQRSSAAEGVGMIAQVVRRSAGRCRVMAAGGITPENIRDVLMRSGAGEVHVGGAAGRAVEYPHAGMFDSRRTIVDVQRVRDLVTASNV
jgi:copper homeostasis protein